MANDPELNRQRRRCVALSLFCIALAVIAILGLWSQQQTTAAVPLLVFFSYLIAASCLITFTAGRLYAQHELRRWRIDMGSSIALMTLAALPFCFANLLWSCVDAMEATEIAADRQYLMLLLSLVLGFFLLPTFFVTEALMSLLTDRRGRQ